TRTSTPPPTTGAISPASSPSARSSARWPRPLVDSGELAHVRLTVNGTPREGRCVPRKLLVDFVREDLGLTGTHVGCEHGICGACTILVDGEAARSCLMLAVQADGAEVVSSEGLRGDGAVVPLQ